MTIGQAIVRIVWRSPMALGATAAPPLVLAHCPVLPHASQRPKVVRQATSVK